MRKTLLFIVLVLCSPSLWQPAQAASTLTLNVSQTPSAGEAVVTLYGTLKPARSGIPISIQVNISGSWQNTRFATRTTKLGLWKITAQATALDAAVKYRAQARIGSSTSTSPVRSLTVKQTPEITNANPELLIDQFGPGGRIHGIDISRWQHPNDKAIDFVKMYSAGIRFVMIKASDSRDEADVLAVKYLAMDHAAAQAAGIYTGFYHYAVLPNTKDPDVIREDARVQVQKVIWRLAAIGGYVERDLSYALDLENNCVSYNSAKSCLKYAPRSVVTMWAKTFLTELRARTGRTPFLYSYPQFLENAMTRDNELAQFPLWLAQYAINPFDPLNQPGLKTGGCYVHPWTSSNCVSQWTVWQYTSCGIAEKYGVPGTRVDLNVFRGTPSTFLNLTKGTWIPEISDFMPRLESTTMTIQNVYATTTDKYVIVNVTVARPDGSPVVTGSVKFVADPSTPLKASQSLDRATSGQWKLGLSNVPAGTYLGKILFSDVSGTHDTSSQQISFTVQQGPTPAATIKPAPKPTKAVDGCKNQIKN